MSIDATIDKHIQLDAAHADLLAALAQAREASEDEVVARALEIFSMLENVSGESGGDLYEISLPSLAAVWDNESDAVYDNWREAYGVPAR